MYNLATARLALVAGYSSNIRKKRKEFVSNLEFITYRGFDFSDSVPIRFRSDPDSLGQHGRVGNLKECGSRGGGVGPRRRRRIPEAKSSIYVQITRSELWRSCMRDGGKERK
jgi:hypothetical protein